MVMLALASPAVADPVQVPSGQAITFVDVITDAPGTAGVTWRYRFLAPAIARDTGTISAEVAATDIDTICANFVIPDLRHLGTVPDQVIVSLSDRTIEFGTPTPEATQLFEAYRIDGDTCIWEGF